MSKRNYVKVAFVDRNNINDLGEEVAKLVFIMTKEWASAMSVGVSQILADPYAVNNLSDYDLADTLDSMSEQALESIAVGIQIGSGNNFNIVNTIMEMIKRSINSNDEMLAVIESRSPGLPLSIALEHNYPNIIMKSVNASDIEYSLHFDLNTREVFFVVENNLKSTLEFLSGFPIDPDELNDLAGEDFYSTPTVAANDDLYDSEDLIGDDNIDQIEAFKAALKQFEDLNASINSEQLYSDEEPFVSVEEGDSDDVVEQTEEIEYAARVFTIFGELEDERTGHSGQLQELIMWASSLAKLDGLRYDIVRVVTTTRVSVREESILVEE